MEDPAAVAALLRRRAVDGPLWIDTRGDSMGPRYAGVRRVLVDPLPRRPRLGEVWVFCARDATRLAHRYLRRTDGRYQFRGDAHDRPDEPVPVEWLVGRAAGGQDEEGRLVEFRRRDALAPLLRAAAQALRRRLRGPDGEP